MKRFQWLHQHGLKHLQDNIRLKLTSTNDDFFCEQVRGSYRRRHTCFAGEINNSSISLPWIPVQRLCTHFEHVVHCIEFAPTPALHTPQGNFDFFTNLGASGAEHMSFALPKLLTLRPLSSSSSFQSLSFSLSSSITRSSAYSSSHAQPGLNSIESDSITIMNNRGLNTEP